MSAQLSLSQIQEQTVKHAVSSLQNFSMAISGGLGLKLDAVDKGGVPHVVATLVEEGQLPSDSDAVCSVDWTWICNSKIKSFKASDNVFRFELDPAGPLVVSVGVWQGKPFLSFQPFRK